MALLQNGISISGQLSVLDISEGVGNGVIPDTDFTLQTGSANGSNILARFGTVAIGSNGETTVGSGTPGVLATNTGLGAEHTADGLGRKTGVTTTGPAQIRDGVYTWVSRQAGTGGRFTYSSNWSAVWQYTGSGSAIIREVGIFNDATANTGICLTRQVFDADWQLETNDVIRFIVSVEHDGSFTPGGGSVGGVLTNRGLLELARLLMHETTDRIGYNSVPPFSIEAGDWLDEDHLGATIGVPLKFDVIAIGSSIAATTEGDTTLGAELLAATDPGAPRKSGADIIGEIMAEPGDNETFPVSTFNNFAGDTVQWRPDVVNDAYWEVQSGGWDYGEGGVFNGDATDDAMLIRYVRAATVPFDQVGDRLVPVVRLLSQ